MKTLAPLVEGNVYKMLLTLMIAFCLLPPRRLSCAPWFEGGSSHKSSGASCPRRPFAGSSPGGECRMTALGMCLLD